MGDHNRFSLSLEKLDKLAEDIAKLDVPRVVKTSDKVLPSFQHDGYLEEANKKSLKWNSRFFVLRDSCLLSYDSDHPAKIVEPETCVCLGKCKVQLLEQQDELNKLVGGLIDCAGKQYCIHITTRPDKEHILLCASSEEVRQQWVNAIKVARNITHANMVRLAVENRVFAEEKGAVQVTLDNTTSALAIFSNREYIQKTPITGGAEGWLHTVGFKNSAEDEGKKGVFGSMLGGIFGSSELKKLKKRYCILRDSHLLLYEAGDALLKPRGVMYLVASTAETLPDDSSGHFRFRCSSPLCGDYIDFSASSEKRRKRWMFSLKIGARVTFPDFKMLMQEHSLLADAVMTPRAGPAAVPHKPTLEPDPTSTSGDFMFENLDLQDTEVDAGAEQPYGLDGMPLLRNPSGKLVDVQGIELLPTTPRFGASGVQLDNFNRALPLGAVPMFTAELTPIGVGPDGKHYLADGTQVPESDPHFDAHGNQLDGDTVKAAEAVATNVSMELKVRARLLGDDSGSAEAMVDVLGRTFRDMRDGETQGKLINADGDEVPLMSARVVSTGGEAGGELQLQDYESRKKPEATMATLVVKVDAEDSADDSQEVVSVDVDERTTLQDVRLAIQSDMANLFPPEGFFLFMLDMAPLSKHEEGTRLAMRCLPEITIRGGRDVILQETLAQAPSAVKKVAAMIEAEEKKKQEQKEFELVMERVRSGKFLKPVKTSLLLG